jgi:hypothetical protein
MDRRVALVAHIQPAEATQPGLGALHHPAVVPQSLARLAPFARNPTADPPPPQILPTVRRLVRLVGVHLGRPAARATSGLLDRLDGVQQRLEPTDVVHIGRGEVRRERDALAVDHNMALRARFAAIRRIRAGRLAPFFARTLVLSTLARDQSIPSRSPRRSSSTRCSRCHTPACCHARRRRQQVMPLPQPISWGNSSHGIPVRSTKMIPLSAARSESRGRPPFGLGGSGGSSGSTTVHSSSLTIGFAILPVYQTGAWPTVLLDAHRRLRASRMVFPKDLASSCITPRPDSAMSCPQNLLNILRTLPTHGPGLISSASQWAHN